MDKTTPVVEAETAEVKRGRGHPSEYRQEYCEQVIELGREGKSHAQIAATLDKSRQTLHNWAHAHPDFLDAITRARELAQAWFEDIAQHNLATPGFQASLWAKQMAARFPDEYRETTRTELTGRNGGPMEHRTLLEMTEAELLAAARG